jgi:hypothetical protein
MRLLKNWTKFNEDNHGLWNASKSHFDFNKKENEKVDFVSHKNGVYSLDLNLNLREIGADMIIPNIESSSWHPYCLVSKDKTLLYKLQDYLKSLEFEDFNGVEWYDTRPVNNAVCPFLPAEDFGGKEVPFFGRDEDYSKPMMCEITAEDLRKSSVRNNIIMNDELYKHCEENMGDLPDGKVFSYFTIYNIMRTGEIKKDHIEVGIDVTEGLKKFLNL